MGKNLWAIEASLQAKKCATKALTFNGHTVPAKDIHHAFLAALSIPYAKILSVPEFHIDKYQ